MTTQGAASRAQRASQQVDGQSQAAGYTGALLPTMAAARPGAPKAAE